MKPKVVQIPDRAIPADVRACVQTVLDENWPFVLVAKRPSGTWEVSDWITTVSDHEAIGALAHAQHWILKDCEVEDESDKG